MATAVRGKKWFARGAAALAALVGPVAMAGRVDAGPLPVFSVSQTTGLVSGQKLVVSWDHQPLPALPGVFVVFECAGLFDPADYYRNCNELVLQNPARRSGTFEVTVSQQLIPDDVTLHTCKAAGDEQCHLVLVASETLGVNASVPITFRAPK